MGMNILYALLYLFLAPVGGGLLAGLDRKLAARMQRRVGPPVVQPFYDVLKLFEKERIAVNEAQGFYLAGFLFFMILSAPWERSFLNSSIVTQRKRVVKGNLRDRALDNPYPKGHNQKRFATQPFVCFRF